MHRTGSARLPLHYGTTPRWLFGRMVELSGEISRIIIDEFGSSHFLSRISDPRWFQALSCVIGFDWHSSGTTTTTCGALKIALGKFDDIRVAGGKGASSRKAPREIREGARALSLGEEETSRLVYASKMSAKVDNSCVQDGYALYHHCFFFTKEGWSVVQQGMGERYARRYHWLSSPDFVCEPHSGIASEVRHERVLDMTARESEEARKISCDLVCEGPSRLKKYFSPSPQRTLSDFEMTLPSHHPVLREDLTPRSWEVLRKAYELQPRTYEELVAIEGMGPKKIRALALVSQLIFGHPPCWQDPARFSFAHGGKDGFPYPVDRKVYDSSIQTLRSAIEDSRLGQKEKISALGRLNEYLEE